MKSILIRQFTSGFTIIRILFFAMIIISANIFSQDDIQEYKPPKLMKGFNLTLETAPSLYSNEGTDLRKSNSYSADIYANLTHWRFTNKLLYAVNTSVSAAADKDYYSDPLNNYTEDLGWSSDFDFRISGGASYYPFKDFYANLYINSINSFSSHNYPYLPFEIFPGIGYGRMYNAARVTQMQNFEQVLMDEKIINSPLKNPVRKKLVEILDKRDDRDFLSMFKDDAAIEFFAKIEDLLRDEGVIQGNLGSRAILKMYQALANTAFVYFPVYKGFQVQAETQMFSKYNYDYTGNIQKYCIYFFNSYMLSAIYGLPVNRKLSFIGSAYTVIPVMEKHLEDPLNFEFHSPTTLIEQNSLNPSDEYYIRQREQNYEEPFTKMDIGLSVQGFYSFNRFCGLYSNIYTTFKLRDYEGDDIAGGLSSSFNFNILNHLRLSLFFDANASRTTKYNYDFGTDVIYYMF